MSPPNVEGMKRLRLVHIPLITLLAIGHIADAAEAYRRPDDSYFVDKERGWYWRERQPDKPQVEPEEPAPSGNAPATERSTPLSAEWLRKNMDSYRDAALNNPTPENVEAYMLLQRYSMDMADRFSQVWMDVVAQQAYLDESVDRPISHVAKIERQSAISAERERILKSLSTRSIGVWYFFRSDCPYCHRQNAVLVALTRLYGIEVLPISLDHGAMNSPEFPSFVLDEGQGARLNVTGTPTLFLNNTETGEIARLTVGFRALNEIEDAALQVARKNKWITEAEYVAATQGTAPVYLVDGGPPPEEVATDPQAMLRYLRSAATPPLMTPLATPGDPQ